MGIISAKCTSVAESVREEGCLKTCRKIMANLAGRLSLKNILCRLLSIPLRNDNVEFEDFFCELNKSLYHENDFINKIMNAITDEEVIYQKGEGPELVLNIDGEIVPRRGAILMCKYFIAKRVELILQSTENLEKKNILDVGATSDLLFRYLNKKGIGLNISEKAVKHMKSLGIEAVLGDATDLKFEDKSFDYLLCFETIEHLENPIKGLKELKRVAKEKIFFSIPNIKDTQICSFESSDRGRHRWHFIEFSKADFKKILQRVGLKVVKEVVIHPYGEPKTLLQKLFVYKWKNHSWFEGFVFYEVTSSSHAE